MADHRFIGEWQRMSRGLGTVDDQGLWHPTFGPWHYAPARYSDRGFLGLSVTALCGTGLFRRRKFDVQHHGRSDLPDGAICAKCKRLAPTTTDEGDDRG